ncbi:hypothetical protein F2Q69_00009865 [Brassica cretica]|uniref:Uncharacterized protein n=1 Tax=Brassica cretica TaxID=69181 RepID=A0A8S9NPV3_BRACR|nr:hypothetical protein F2Q69_00009865 [Brassica cretica]
MEDLDNEYKNYWETTMFFQNQELEFDRHFQNLLAVERSVFGFRRLEFAGRSRNGLVRLVAAVFGVRVGVGVGGCVSIVWLLFVLPTLTLPQIVVRFEAKGS